MTEGHQRTSRNVPAPVDPDQAMRMLRWLLARGYPGLSSRYVAHHEVCGFKAPSRANAALQWLADQGYGTVEPTKPPGTRGPGHYLMFTPKR